MAKTYGKHVVFLLYLYIKTFIYRPINKWWNYVANLEFTKPPPLRRVKGEDSPPLEVWQLDMYGELIYIIL